MKTITGTEAVLDEMRRGALMMANGCTAMIQRPDGSCAYVNRGTVKALLKQHALFVITRSGPSELHYRLLESIVPLAWVPVAERLPDDDRNVLIVDHNDEVWFGWYGSHAGEKCWFYFDGTFASVTHWMDLPATPAGRRLRNAGMQRDGGQLYPPAPCH